MVGRARWGQRTQMCWLGGCCEQKVVPSCMFCRATWADTHPLVPPSSAPARPPAEIASGPGLGVELDKWVRTKGVEGIVNGMDVEEWSPALVG